MDSKPTRAVSDQSLAPPVPIANSKKRHRSEGDVGAVGGGGRKRAHRAHSTSSTKHDPAFASAHRIPLADLTETTPAGEDRYVAGSVVDARQQGTRNVTLAITDSSTNVPLKIIFRGSWASAIPQADASAAKLHVSLKGVRWEPLPAVFGGMRKYAAVFEEGARIRVRGEAFDGFEAARKVADRSSAVTEGASQPVAAASIVGVASPTSPPPTEPDPRSSEALERPSAVSIAEMDLARHPSPAPVEQAPLDLPPIGNKRPRSSSPGPSVSSKRHMPSGLPAFDLLESDLGESEATDLPQVGPSTTPSATPPPRPAALMPVTRPSSPPARTGVLATGQPCTGPEPLPQPQPRPAPSFASGAPPMRLKIVERIRLLDETLKREEQQAELDAIVDALIKLPPPRWMEMLASERVFAQTVADLRTELAATAQVDKRDARETLLKGTATASADDDDGQSTRRDAEEGQIPANELLRSREAAPSATDAQLEVPLTHPDDLPGPSRHRPAESVLALVDGTAEDGGGSGTVDDVCSSHQGFETRTPKFRYYSISDVKQRPIHRPTAVVGIVGAIDGPKKTAKDRYMSVMLYDSTGEIEVKMFATSFSHLPSLDQLQVGDVFFIRETPLKRYKGKVELVAGSFDKQSIWARWDAQVQTLLVQPNRPDQSKDLADPSKLDPAIRDYAKKLMRWKETQGRPVVVQPRGRPTLRVEEIQDDKQFFNCIVQVIKSEIRACARTVYVTDWTSNPLLDPAPMLYEREPAKPFGQHTLTVSLWNDLAYDDHSSLETGRLVKLHNLKPRLRGDHWEATIYSSDGGRIERLRPADPQLVALLARREAHVQLGIDQSHLEAVAPLSIARAEPAPRPNPGPTPAVTIISVAPTEPAPASPSTSPPVVESVDPSKEAGPSRLPHISPPPPTSVRVAEPQSAKGKEREHTSDITATANGVARKPKFQTDSTDCSVFGFEDASPTQALYYDVQHPNGSSLLEIVSSDRLKFRTRATISDFIPKALEDVVVATCDRCDADLPATDKRCRSCNDVTGDYTIWRYRLVLTLSDGTGTVRAAMFDEDMHTLFPSLPPASEYQHSPTNPMDYLAKELARLVSFDASEPGPLLDLSIRKFRIRGVTGANEDGWAWSYRVFATVLKGERG